MPGRWARSAAGSAASRSIAARRSAQDSSRSTNGPCRPGAAPHSRPSCWNVRDVATAVRGPSHRMRAATSRSWCRTRRRSARTCEGGGGSCPAKNSWVSRPAPSGSEATKSGRRPRPKATSREPPPMSSRASGPDRQPIQRRAPRKVSSASTSPGRVHSATSVRDRTSCSTSCRFGAPRTTAVAKASGPAAPHRAAVRLAAATASTSWSTVSSGSGSPGATSSDSRSRHFAVCTGSGTPSSVSATTSLTVFDPTSITLVRMARGYPLGVSPTARSETRRTEGGPPRGRSGARTTREARRFRPGRAPTPAAAAPVRAAVRPCRPTGRPAGPVAPPCRPPSPPPGPRPAPSTAGAR